MAEDVFGIVGSVIAGAYHVEAVVAEGTLGVVYRARKRGAAAPVALKVLKVPNPNAERRSAVLRQLETELALVSRLFSGSPTVALPESVASFNTRDDRLVPYLVGEWLEGATLGALIEQRNRDRLEPVPLRKLVRLLTPAARALERAHGFSGPEGLVPIVHRDLKPENLFLARVAGEELIRVLDFGIGKLRAVFAEISEPPGSFTSAHAAPEQWLPKQFGRTGPWTDVWSFALCMVEVLAGRPLIVGDVAAIRNAALDPARRPTPRAIGLTVPDSVEAVFARALALEPRARQQEAGAFWSELAAALQGSDSERDQSAQGERGFPSEREEVRSRSGQVRRAQNTAAGRAREVDLEFDPTVASVRFAPAVEVVADPPVPHFVPDLELAPALPRKPSGSRPAVVPKAADPRTRAPDAHSSGAHTAISDLEDSSGPSPSLDLDLPVHEPIARRSASSPGLRAVQAPVASQSSHPPPRRVSQPPGPKPLALDSLLGDSPPSVSGVVAVRVASPLVLATPLPSAAARSAERGPAPRTPTARRDTGSVETGFAAKILLNVPEERPLLQRLRPAFVLLGVSLVIAMCNPIYAGLTGEVLEFAGLRPSFFGVVFFLSALALAGREVFREP